MSRMFILIILGILAGLCIGYAIFAQAGDSYIPVKDLISIKGNTTPDTLQGVVQSLGKSLEEIILDLKTKRRNILISGLAGGLIGAFVAAFLQRRNS